MMIAVSIGGPLYSSTNGSILVSAEALCRDSTDFRKPDDERSRPRGGLCFSYAQVVALFKQALADGRQRMVMHTLWDLENENPATSYTGVGQGGGDTHSGDMRRTEGQHSRMELWESAIYP